MLWDAEHHAQRAVPFGNEAPIDHRAAYRELVCVAMATVHAPVPKSVHRTQTIIARGWAFSGNQIRHHDEESRLAFQHEVRVDGANRSALAR